MAINIVVPRLGESVVEARVARWLKREGEAVAAGEPVVELETEKIDLEVGAEQAGVLASIKHPEGADVKVGDVLAVVEPGAAAAAPSADAGTAPTPPACRAQQRVSANRQSPRTNVPRASRSQCPDRREAAPRRCQPAAHGRSGRPTPR